MKKNKFDFDFGIGESADGYSKVDMQVAMTRIPAGASRMEKFDDTRRTEPFSTYKDYLRIYIERARERGMTPVLITSVHRRYFEADGRLMDTHGDYLEAMKELAEEERVPLIDLAANSKRLFEELGAEAAKSLFMWGARGEFIHFPGGVEDNTHFQAAGAIQIAGLVTEGLRELRLPQLLVAFRS